MTDTERARFAKWYLETHRRLTQEPSTRFRTFGDQSPHGASPIFCSLCVLCEPNLPEAERWICAQGLFFHSLLENTTGLVPAICDSEVTALVQEMAFPGGSEDERENLWRRSPRAKLCMLYVKVSDHIESTPLPPEKRRQNGEYILRLAVKAEKHYGPLTMITIARALVAANP